MQMRLLSGLEKLANCPKDESSLTALFFHLLQLFGDKRGAIALMQNLENAHQFGRRRDANFDTSKDFYCKYIENEQEKTDLSSFFALQIQSMQLKKNFTKSQKRLQDRCSAFQIEVLEKAYLAKKGWLALPSFNHFPFDFPTHLIEERTCQGKLDANDMQTLRRSIKVLKKTHPEFYARIKISAVIMDWQQTYAFSLSSNASNNHSSAHLDEEKKAAPPYFAIGTSRLQIQGKMYAASQYVIGFFSTHKPFQAVQTQENLPVAVIYQDVFLINDSLNEMGKIFTKAVCCERQHDKALKESVASLRYYLAHTKPFERGNTSTGEWFESLLYAFHSKIVTYSNLKIY